LEFAVKVEIVLPSAEMVRILNDRDVHVSIRAKLVDLGCYNSIFKTGKGAFSK
jgi:hypothetical protein